ncbi:hypothetical protein M899_1078 [Bacteriovorax sp. BSW11_IV]|uniref:hypothetical protein n=1 Tax=Bacteriovorax sp. BSW11_IV TaxID=1353529 RepID=UPI000389DE3D|nr:hypothetical protein [Bacteriovorax sp. BSW11_IV]EQC45218.1 hypothetical protein M899_1078 [Bacteriovorax sp. BSW11_IV]
MTFRVIALFVLLSFKVNADQNTSECVDMLKIANTHYFLAVNASRNMNYKYEEIKDEECSEILRNQLASLAEALERYEFYSMSSKVTAINIQSAYLSKICSLDLATKAGHLILRLNRLRLKNAIVAKNAKVAISCSELFE